ncbi:MAG: glycosyltransferase [Pseudohongiellaceae bacterium]|nr:glycosyltransferase [Pseudohongiellaceae bacterium]
MSKPISLSASIVLFHPDADWLGDTLRSLSAAFVHARDKGLLASLGVTLIHNDDTLAHDCAPSVQEQIASMRAQGITVDHSFGHGNIGFGAGHNIAIRQSEAEFHLVLNPDLKLADDALTQALSFLTGRKEVALVAPQIKNDAGESLHGCKRYPSVFDFLLRGFAPQMLKRRFAKRLAHYEMHDLAEDTVSVDIPISSGCCMLFRTHALLQAEGFDERYFLYFEDFDISIRIRAYGLIAYVPWVHVIHHGGHSAKKGWRHILMFARSGLRFFHSHGWRLL